VDLLDLIGRDTQLVRVASTGGGEYAGPCPFCGGSDRLHVQPRRPGGGRWFCRQCTPRWRDALDYVRRREGAGLHEAVALLTAWASLSPLPTPQGISATGEPGRRSKAGWQREAERELRSAQTLLNDAAGGEPGRAYLSGRAILSAAWQAWGLGYLHAWHPQLATRRPAICLPWRSGGVIEAVQYRFIPAPGANGDQAADVPKGERFSQRKGGRRVLFGLDLAQGRDGIVLCEGELNALSLWQALAPRGYDVVSWGPQGNILRDQVAAAGSALVDRYRRVIVWADALPLAVEALRLIGAGRRGLAVCSDGGLDANDRLRRGDLDEFLEAVI